MKKNSIFIMTALAAIFALSGSGCGLFHKNTDATYAGAQNGADLTNSNIPGMGSASVPTTDAIVGRVLNGLSGTTVTSSAGNFSTALKQLGTNLPQNANPLKATGFDQVPLLVYAACADVKTGSFGVDFTKSVSSQSAALVAAGVKMLDRHVGGLASSGPMAAQVSQVFQQLVNDDSCPTTSGGNCAGDNTQLTFISVCLAANSYGVGMRGF